MPKPKSLSFSSIWDRRQTAIDQTKRTAGRGIGFVRRHKARATAIVGALLLLIIIASFFVRTPVEAPTSPNVQALQVQYFQLGKNNLVEDAVGTVKNLSSITLVAQTAGPVSEIYKHEGEYVTAGTWIAYQETAYGAGSAASVSRQIAQTNATLAEETFKNTVDTVAKQRELADLNRENTEELRRISQNAQGATQNLINTTKQVITSIEESIAATSDPATIQGLRQQLIGFQANLSQAETLITNTSYQTNTDNPPTEIAEISRDLIFTQTEIQLKAAQLQKDIAGLNVRVAQIQEATSRVAAPFEGSIERIYVQPGEYVTPGTPVAKIKGNGKICIEIQVSAQTAARINTEKALTLLVDGVEYSVPISHVSTTPTAGSLYEVLALIPEEYNKKVHEGATVRVQLPTYAVSSGSSANSIPLDAVYVTNTGRYVFIAKDGKAFRQPIQTGTIAGSQIEVKSGLSGSEKVILDRRVMEGQAIELTVD